MTDEHLVTSVSVVIPLQQSAIAQQSAAAAVSAAAAAAHCGAVLPPAAVATPGCPAGATLSNSAGNNHGFDKQS